MTTEETGDLLAACASFDNRTTGPLDVIAWKRAIGDLDFADCETAVIAHYGESTERIMPGHIRARVKAIRRARIERDIVPAPAPELTNEPGKYREELKRNIREIADGRSLQRAIGRLPGETPPPLDELRRELGPGLPPPERDQPLEEIARRQVAESRTRRGASSEAQEPSTPEDPAA